MKTMTKRTAVAALTGVMAVGMLTGCGEKKWPMQITVRSEEHTSELRHVALSRMPSSA